MFGLFKRRGSVTNINIDLVDARLKAKHDARVTELLEHNNAQLQQIRDLKALARRLANVAGHSADLLIEHSATTGYCGCDLEKETFLVIKKAEELLNV